MSVTKIGISDLHKELKITIIEKIFRNFDLLQITLKNILKFNNYQYINVSLKITFFEPYAWNPQ